MSNRQQRRLQQKALRKQRKGQGPALPVVTADNLAQSMSTAIQFHQNNQFREASALYEQILAIEPAHVGALSGKGMIDYQAGRFDEARTAVEAAIKGGAREAGYFMNLGAICEAQADLDAAEAAYTEAIARDIRYRDAYYNLGNVHLKRGEAAKAITVFDACMATLGREFHALAYKAHALVDSDRIDEAQRLLDFDTYVKPYQFDVPSDFPTLSEFNKAATRYIKTHPTLRGDVMSTENGRHTGELIKPPLGPLEGMVGRINEAINWYKKQLPDDPDHPAVRWAPDRWNLTAWGVVMHDKGHERAHIHPNGWLSGVFYVQLPKVIEDEARNPEGWLEFGRPTSDLAVKGELGLRHYKPELGQMFLFPSYYYHGTVPFRSSERRVCIAFDVEPVY